MVGAAVKTPAPPMQPTAKPKVNPPQREPGTAPKRPGMPAPIVRVVISIVIVWHFAGIFFAAVSIHGPSDLVIDLSQKPPMQWYLDALYLNQGHSFFAPEVGPGHLIRYQLYDQSGRMTEQGELPSRKEHWPRLFYHRHFMLADQSEFQTDNKQVHDYWQKRYLDAFADHLLRVNENAASVRLQRIAHFPLPRDLALKGRKMTDPESYQLLGETTRSRRDLGPEPGAEVSSLQGTRPNANWQVNGPNTNLQYNQQYNQMNTASRRGGPPR